MNQDKNKFGMTKELQKNLIIAVSLAIVLGLGWGIGLLASSSYEAHELSFIFQVIFAIFVGSQGVFIFLLHGLRNADFREFWLKLCRCGKSQLPVHTVSSSQKDKSFPIPSGSDSGTASVALSTSPSYPEKIDLPKIVEESLIDVCSMEQSPTDSVFAHECEVIVNDACRDVEEGKIVKSTPKED